MKILVTGSSGFLGKKLVKILLRSNHKVFGIDIKKNDKFENKNFKYLKLNLNNLGNLKKNIKKIKKIDLIIHTAAKQPYKAEFDIENYFKINFSGTKNLLEVCKINKIQKLIQCSSFSIYGNLKSPISENDVPNPRNTYGLSKLLTENLLKFYSEKYSMKIIVLRFDGIYGPKQNLPGFIKMSFKAAKRNNSINLFNMGKLKRDYIYIDDAVKAINMSMKKIDKIRFKILNIGGGSAISSHSLVKKIIKICKSSSKILLVKKNNKNFSKDIYMNIKEAKKFLKFKPLNINKNLIKMYNAEKK